MLNYLAFFRQKHQQATLYFLHEEKRTFTYSNSNYLFINLVTFVDLDQYPYYYRILQCYYHVLGI